MVTLIPKFDYFSAEYGHCTMVLTDRATKVGCAVGQYTYNAGNLPGKPLMGLKVTVIACDYSSTNMDASPVYRVGPTASKCQSTNPEYPALCGPNDPIDPNDFS